VKKQRNFLYTFIEMTRSAQFFSNRLNSASDSYLNALQQKNLHPMLQWCPPPQASVAIFILPGGQSEVQSGAIERMES